MPRSDFIHLHLHTQYSLLDGACRIPDILNLAKRYKMDSLAITDHGNMFGAVDFYLEAQKAGIKPIIGCEAYIAPGSRLNKSSVGIEDACYHLILLAKDESGYENLMKLVSIGYLEGFYYRPRIDKEVLSRHAKGLIGLTACLKGEIPSLLQEKRFNDALKAADAYLNIFGKDNLYLELQANSIPEQKIVNQGLIKISKELNLPLVATNDVHYVKKEDAPAHEALLCIQTQTTLDDPNRMRFQTDEFYLRSPEEMKEVFKDFPEAISNTLEIAGRCNLELDFSKVHLPKYEPPKGISKEAFLKELCIERLKEKYDEVTPAIKERLDHELRIIKDMGFVSYFLIVWDFIHYAKSQNIPVGPGRGSAAGSLTSFLLGITDVDPLKYGLLFERFLNPERLGLPDIDIDFCYERRQEVIDYVTNKYGRENVAQIITFGTMQSRAVVRDVGRVMGINYADVDRIAKMIPPDPGIKLKDALESEQELKNLYKNDPQITKLINIALKLEGLNRHASIHAAGVVIGDRPLNNYMPLFETQGEQVTTGYSMGVLEKIGLLKVDFLGLRTLTVISETLKLVKETQGKSIDIDKLPLDDSKTYELLTKSKTFGVFQLESSGMRDLLRKLEPSRFEDIIALLALYRPGPIGSGMLDDFMARKHNRLPIKYDHKKLEPILKETYGIMVYQEQIMQVASSLAGFSLADADLLRRAMSKKIPEVMEKQRSNFVIGCAKNAISSSVANKIFDLIEYFSGYGFNKCVVGSTEIINADTGKNVTVKELFERKDSVKFTFSCDDNLKVKKSKIKDIVYNGNKPVFRLKTILGKEIIATSNHPLLTFAGWKDLGELRMGERIALVRTIPFQGGVTLEPYKIITLAGVLSEGNTCHPSAIYYNNQEILVDDFINNVEKFENTVARVYKRRGGFEVCVGTGKDTKFIKGNTPWNKGLTKDTYYSTILLLSNKKCGARIWIEELGLSYKKASEKFIPQKIFCLNNKELALFLGRLWSGDGFVFSKENKANSIPFYATSSYKLSRQLQELLLRYGIVTCLKKKLFRYRYKDIYKERQGYALYVFGRESVIKFSEHIIPFIVGKDEQIRQLRAYYKLIAPSLESKDTLPSEIKRIVQEEKEKSGISWRDLEKRTGICMKEFCGSMKLHKKGFRKNTILRLAQFFESPQLLRFVNSDIVWDRVEFVEYIGIEPTYDLEIEKVHNFVANGIIVHNSHSTAYALISYRTAYLKANFPVEFMTALLTSERDNTDKIVEYVNEVSRMGLKVMPPDINESEALFKVEDQNTIRFGLLAVKNVGRGAAESIVEARKKGGFDSLNNLCLNIDLRLVNRKVLEALIKCGALDSFNLPRAMMFASLDIILESASRSQKEKARGQLSFFDKSLQGNGFKDMTKDIPRVREWPEPQLLAFEKDMLGFYISGHPLARYAKQLKRFSSSSTGTLSKHSDQDAIKLVGLIAKIKNTVTRAKQEKMSILKIEDLTGIVEGLVFPRTYQRVSRYIQPNTVVLIRGTLNLREDTPKILINDLFPFDEIYTLVTGVSINISGLRENIFESLKELLASSRGNVPIYLNLDTPTKSKVQLVVGEALYVTPSEELLQNIDDLLGEDRLSLTI
ncbi:MAG: DNA polymerase III subunit alpha [Candidatus Omnitrophica bacterium]|nr:DNA polymerase III subunit alpha [Candidatus Omnitrophota bacterium]